MVGAIRRRKQLDELFNKTKYLLEVYADPDFSEMSETASLYLLSKVELETPDILYALQKAYGNNVKIYVDTHPNSLMFVGKRIIWRQGKWYI